MDANVVAVQRLFPDRSQTAVSSDGALTIRGAYPYDLQRALLPDAFDPRFVQVIEGIRSDPHWGPVYRGQLDQFGGDQSAADLALCGELARRGLGAGTIDTAMRTSQLFREKWERDDYRQRTIALALAGVAVHTLPDAPSELLALDNGLVNAGSVAPAPRDWVVKGLLLAGKVTVLAGFGGSSKTQAALQLAMAVATGATFMGQETVMGPVLILSGEEDREELQRRINAVIRYQTFGPSSIEDINENLRAFPLVGTDIRLTARDRDGLSETGIGKAIVAAAHKFGRVRLIVLDHVGLLHGGDFNAREDASMTMRVINGIAKETGAAVVLLAHSPKNAAAQDESDASMIAGSTAFVDQARGGLIMATMRPKEAKRLAISESARKSYVSLCAVKANYAAIENATWFRRVGFDEVGVLEHVQLQQSAPGERAAANLTANIIAAIRHAPGQYSKTRLREVFSGKAKSWRASKGELEGVVEMMITAGDLINRSPTADERARFGHGSQVKHVLDLPH